MHINSISDNTIKTFIVTRQVHDIIKIPVVKNICWEIIWNNYFLMKGFYFAQLPFFKDKNVSQYWDALFLCQYISKTNKQTNKTHPFYKQ